jgi:outer membrane protein OmpA-like peptidoglycan-associated protein
MTPTKTLLAASAAILAVTACTPIETNTGNPRQRTTEGAILGGLAGAVIGARTGTNDRDSRNQAIAGALVGAAAGGLLGDRLDRQAAALQSQVSPGTGVAVVGDEIRVQMPTDILFAVDSASLRPDLRSDLRAVARNLLEYPDSTIIVTGHTDNTGSAAYNQSLSERRANAVASELIGNGVPAFRIRAIGRGFSQPIASNDTAAGRAQNRRVEITIRPNG